MWRDIQPSMVTHTRKSCSAFNPSKVHTHSSEHTQREHTEQWAAIYAAAPGNSWGFGALLKALTRGIEGGKSAVHSLPHLQFLPARDSNIEPCDYSLPLGHDFP